MNAKKKANYNAGSKAIHFVEATDYKTTVDAFNKIKKEIVNRKKNQ